MCKKKEKSTLNGVCAQLLSHVHLFATPWTVAHQVSLSIKFSRQGYWSRLPFPSPVDLLDPGVEPRSPALQTDSLLSEPPGSIYIGNRKNNLTVCTDVSV